MVISNDRALEGRTMLISGGSRGIGEAIAIHAARQGANIALIAKTSEPHPRLSGTIFTAAAAIEKAGGQALPIVGDIRDDDSVTSAVARTADEFGGIDIVVNNASAIDLTASEHISIKKYDLMQDINARGACREAVLDGAEVELPCIGVVVSDDVGEPHLVRRARGEVTLGQVVIAGPPGREQSPESTASFAGSVSAPREVLQVRMCGTHATPRCIVMPATQTMPAGKPGGREGRFDECWA